MPKRLGTAGLEKKKKVGDNQAGGKKLMNLEVCQVDKGGAAAKSLQSCPALCDPETAAHQAPRPWDSPGKNTGVGCHFLLQCMQVKSESGVSQSCPTPSDPMDCSLPGSFVHGIFQARVLEWGAIVVSAKYKPSKELGVGEDS